MHLYRLISEMNHSINSKTGKKNPQYWAEQTCKSLISSSDAESIFGGLLGSCVYRYSKKLSPIITITNPFGTPYVEKLQFHWIGGDNMNWEPKVDRLNSLLAELDYKKWRISSKNELDIDLSNISSIKF